MPRPQNHNPHPAGGRAADLGTGSHALRVRLGIEVLEDRSLLSTGLEPPTVLTAAGAGESTFGEVFLSAQLVPRSSSVILVPASASVLFPTPGPDAYQVVDITPWEHGVDTASPIGSDPLGTLAGVFVDGWRRAEVELVNPAAEGRPSGESVRLSETGADAYPPAEEEAADESADVSALLEDGLFLDAVNDLTVGTVGAARSLGRPKGDGPLDLAASTWGDGSDAGSAGQEGGGAGGGGAAGGAGGG